MQSDAVKGAPRRSGADEDEIVPVVAHTSALRAFISRKFGQRHEVEDLVQDCYVRLLSAQRKAVVEHPKSYLFQTAKNLIIDRLRRQSGSPIDTTAELSAEEEIASSEPTPEEIAMSASMQRALQSALAELPESTRRTFYLIRFCGLSSPEVAERMGVSTRMVQKHLKRCIEHLYARMHAD
jgi:RNA polymerase sigma-70 factor (ECF subfamily)